MPRSKASRGRGKGGASGNRSTGISFVPFAGSTEQNGNHGFSLQFEALNTQRYQLSDSDQRLRHAKVNFVSAGGFESSKLLEPEVALAEMSLQDKSEKIVTLHALVEEESGSAKVDEIHSDKQQNGNAPFFIDTEGDQSVTTGLPPPNIRPSSPTPSDSSEEVIVFAGRDKVGRGISRNFAPSREYSRDTYDSQIKVIDDKIEHQKFLLASLSMADAPKIRGSQSEGGKEGLSLLSRSRNTPSIPKPSTVETDYSHNSVLPLKTKLNVRIQKSKKKKEEQALLDDYIANMEADEVDQLGWYNQRELGGADSDAWQDTDASSKSLTKRRSGGDGWGRDELCGFDNLSTSDGVFGSIQAILSKRERQSGLQYLVVWEGQGVDEARWVPRLNLTDFISIKLIGDFEADEKLVAEMLDDDGDDNTSSEGDDGDSLSIDEEVDKNLDKLDLKQRKIERLSDDEIARLLSKQEEFGMGSAEILLLHNQGGDQDGEEEMEIQIVPKQTQPGKRAMRAAKKPRGDFPAASALADAYDGFDVMDFERPSLKKKSKGRKGKLSFDLSDSELETSMERAWNNDRMMKKQKKEEREELRVLGLLGNRNNKPDLKAKYKEGMGITSVKDEIKEFLKGDNTTLTLPPMDKADRKVVHEIANAFNLKSKSAGSGNKRFPILYRTLRTSAYSDRAFDAIASSTRRFFPRLDVKRKNSGAKSNGNSRGGGFASAAVSYRDGDIVGGSAPELGMENKGRAMLEKMGWSSGTALGALNNKGILQPVSHVVKTTKAGLG